MFPPCFLLVVLWVTLPTHVKLLHLAYRYFHFGTRLLAVHFHRLSAVLLHPSIKTACFEPFLPCSAAAA